MTTNPTRGKAASVLGLLLCLLLVLASPIVRAAGELVLVKQVTALDDAAAAAYAEGDFDKMKKYLLKASTLGARTLGTQPIMARVYLHIGVLYADGLDKRALSVKYFGKALTIRPDIEVRSNMATKTVMSAFAEASRLQAGTNETSRPAPTTVARKEAPAEKDQKAGREVAQAEQRPAETGGAPERCRASSELADVKRQARDELDRLEKALSMAKDALAKERTDSEKFRKDKMELERALGEAKQRVSQLENDGKQKDKRAAVSMEREKKVHDAADALEKEKAEKDSLILETAQRIQELEKEKAEKDKQIAALTQREKRERDAREKLERDRQTAEAREHERKAWEERVRAERDQLEAGPQLDALVAERVMGEPMPGYAPISGSSPDGAKWWTAAEDDEPPWRPAPFSQHLGSAQAVFQKLLDLGWHFDIKDEAAVGWRVVTFNGERGEAGLGATLSLAICRAALKAIGKP